MGPLHVPDMGESSYVQPQPSVDSDFRDNYQCPGLQMRRLRLCGALVLRSPSWDMVDRCSEERSTVLFPQRPRWAAWFHDIIGGEDLFLRV